MKSYTFLLFTLSLLCCCKNDDDGGRTDPIDQLPPATQTGEQTFGCLINGEPFVPPSFGSNAPNAFYQFVDGAYTLGISAGTGGGSELESVLVGALDINEIIESNYQLKSEQSGNFLGKYLIGGGIQLSAVTTDENPGLLIITNFDNSNFIISGTFEFTVLDDENNEINITNGRFDLNYTN